MLRPILNNRQCLTQVRRFASNRPSFRPHLPDIWKDASRTSPLKQGPYNKRRFAGHPEVYIALGCVAYAAFTGTRLMANKVAADEVRVPLWSRIWAPKHSGYREMDEPDASIASNI
ncbi:hypothetical protein BDF19DRAFT_416277 [Syncephalis fuscata]|nr:hypothetical protein BDF19DRAFT_416277 [Syncephalis fuscata]